MHISGQQNSIVVTPSLYYTSDDALKQLKPKQRQCYSDKEVNLTYLAWGRGFKYDMSNCLLNLALDKCFRNCNCTPFFATALRPLGSPFCTGINTHFHMANIG